MDAVQEVRDAFSASESHLATLHQYLHAQLAVFCDAQSYVLKDRIKSLASVAAKLQQGRYKSWAELDDLVAFTIVVPTRSHEAAVESWLSETFEREKTKSRANVPKPPDTFRFDSTRWYGRIPVAAVVTEEMKLLRRFIFEVQVKTVFEDAWSVVTHDIVYKGDDPTWGKARLASQLKAAVEQIDALVDQFEMAASNVPNSPHAQTTMVSSAIATLRALFDERLIDVALLPNSWTSLANNLWSFSRKQKVEGSDGYRKPEKVFPKIVSEFDQAVREGRFSPLLSATLFDSIITFAVMDNIATSNDFFLIKSKMIESNFGFEVPKQIDLDAAFEG